MIVDLSELRTRRSYYCGYCGVGTKLKYKFTPKNLCESQLSEILINCGWVRYSDTWTKYDFQNNCCFPVQTRITLSKFFFTQKYEKVTQRMMYVLQNEFMSNPDFLLQEKLEILNQDFTVFKLSQPQQDLPMHEPKPQSQKQPTQPPLQEKNYPQPPATSQNLEQLLLAILSAFKPLILNRLGELMQFLADYFQTCEIDSEVALQVFTLEINMEKLKFFPSDKKHPGACYTNYLMLVYGCNKIALFQKLSLEKFVQLTKPFFKAVFTHELYNFQIEDTGYLTIWKCSQGNLQGEADFIVPLKSEKAQQPKVLKVTQRQKPTVSEPQVPTIVYREPNKICHLQKQQKGKADNENCQKQNPPTPELISNFSGDSFNVGLLRVELRTAKYEDDEYLLYEKYFSDVHNKTTTVDGYIEFLCTSCLKQGVEEKVHEGQRRLRFYGTHHMRYSLGDQLVAVGVLDFYENTLFSVYLFYDPSLKVHNFGIFAGLVEIEFARKLSTDFPQIQYYSMAYTILTCPKMSYKGKFPAIEVQCSCTYRWLELTKPLKKRIKHMSKVQNGRVTRLTEQDVIPSFNIAKEDLQALKIQPKYGQEAKYGEINKADCMLIENPLLHSLNLLGKEAASQITFLY